MRSWGYLLCSSLWLISLASPAWAQFTDPPVLEACDGAEDPLATNWSGPILAADTSQMREVGGGCERQPVAGDGSSYWDVATFGPDLRAMLTCIGGCSGAVSAGLVVDVWVRIQNPNSAGATDAYLCRAFPRNTTELVRIYRVEDDIATQVASANVALDDGHKLGCEAIGATIKAYVHNGTSWAEAVSYTDPSPLTLAGRFGVRANTGNIDVDNMGAATIAGTSARRRTSPMRFE